MAAAMRAAIDWMEEQFLAERIYLRVLDDNQHAIQFYRKLGFVETTAARRCKGLSRAIRSGFNHWKQGRAGRLTRILS